MTNTTREQRLRELCVRWRGRGVKGGSSDVCADELAAILAEPVEVSDSDVADEHLAYHDHLELHPNDDFEPIREALTAALKEPGQ